ncbi:MAG: hypothetical protein H6Q86_4427 [candidate division NC10 bacterium]|nr:hypothetical protein [candidate division NC10 bacterium]
MNRDARRTQQPRPLSAPGWSAYYYHYDIAAGDWFEILSLPELGGLWRRAFGPIENGHERLLVLAGRAGVLLRNRVL